MKRVELDSADTTAQWLVYRFKRYFFVLLALLSIFITAIVFVPAFVKLASGTFPLAWALNVHGALMAAWLAIFLAQAILASTGRLKLHRKLGTFGLVLGIPVWASMLLVELRARVVYPLEPDLSKSYDWDLPGIYVLATFPIFLVGAIYQRHRWPAWHKRFMAFATIVAVQAAEQRNLWLPRFGPGYWSDVIYLDTFLLVPLVVYDYLSAKRVHPATIAASCVLLGAQGVLLFVWGHPAWRHAAYLFAVAVRSAF